MGQNFIFLNISKRQNYSGQSAKYGEMFPTDFPADVIKFLAVPESDSCLEKEPVIWAGDRIICIGGYVNDWPDSILAASDCKSLEPPRVLYDYSSDIENNYTNLRHPNYSGNGVLRNLSKKIYVRSEGIPIGKERPKESSIYNSPGLGHVLMSRIGWSEDLSVSMCWDDAKTLAQGEWAGDRFDVRSYEDVKAELESGGWIDATEQEAERVTRIWEAEWKYR